MHLGITGMALYALFNFIDFNLYIAIGAIVGTLVPDFDLWIPFIRHRQQFHSIAMLVFVSLGFVLINISLGIGLFIGFSLHLIMDNLTPMGLPKLYWLIKK